MITSSLKGYTFANNIPIESEWVPVIADKVAPAAPSNHPSNYWPLPAIFRAQLLPAVNYVTYIKMKSRADVATFVFS